MPLVQLEDATLSLGRRKLFAELSLSVGEGERIGLIGPNGSGKTTLLRLFAGELEIDSGSLHRRRGLRVGYLPQQLVVEGGRTLLAFVRQSVPGREALDRAVAETEVELAGLEHAAIDVDARHELASECAQRLADLHERVSHFDADYGDHVALRILSGLGFRPEEKDRDLGELSGGWQMRGVLAGLLLQQPDLLLLDEPTNHLDLPSVAWFSSYLKQYRRSFFLVSHDREFLNEQIGRVVTFEPEGVRSYSGNYERYLVQRAEEAQLLASRQTHLARAREDAEVFIQRFRAQATKARAVQSRIKALARLETVELHKEHRSVHFRFPATPPSSKQVLSIEDLSKSYGTHQVLAGVSLTALRGERIAVIGQNGAGKTTLLKVLAGELERDGGELTFGHNVRRGYYAQHHAETLRASATVYEEVASAASGQSPTAIRTLLGALLFGEQEIDKKVAVLSGGERARVALARLLLVPTNVILMDEPTNHLDLRSSEQLADALSSYDGTIIFVSHNRAFIRQLATRIWNVADGSVESYPGTLDEYMSSAVRRFDVPDPRAGTITSSPGGCETTTVRTSESRADTKERKRREAEERARRHRTLGPLEKELATLEARIAELEALQKERSTKLSDPSQYDDSSEVGTLLKSYSAAQADLEALTARWEKTALAIEAARAAG
ncbi:MAG: ABC-F family ATP-binding cassette domain-containing protein [Myxococcota bacterium]